MPSTRANLDIQSDKVLSDPRVQNRIQLKDELAVQSLNLDWVEPAGADRTVTFVDPGADDTVAYLDAPQVFKNKQITTVPVAGDDITNKTYVDNAIAAATPTATSAPGGGAQGKVTADENKGLLINAGVMEVKVGEGLELSGGGNIRAKLGPGVQLDGANALTVPEATSGPGGATVGRATFDENAGLTALPGGIVRVKVDGTTVSLNGLGELQAPVSSSTVVASKAIVFTQDINAVTPPANGTTGTDIDTLDFPSGSLTGTRFDFTVPEDYVFGAIDLLAVYHMDSATSAPNNQIRLSTQVKIVDVAGGTIDSLTYPETQFNLTVPDNSTDIVRQVIRTIGAGDFAIGDQIQCYIKRYGADNVNDLHGGTWKVIAFEWRYTSGRGGRAVTQAVALFQDASGETRPNAGNIGGDIDTEDFPANADSGLKIVFTVPDEWDGVSDAQIRVDYAMSSAAAGVVRLDTYGEIANVVGGTVDTLPSQLFDLTPPVDTDPHRTVAFRSIPGSMLNKGDLINLVLARRVGVGGNHSGSFKVIVVTMTFGAATVAAGGVQELYLGQPVFGNHSGPGVFADDDFPDFSGDFETLTRMYSTVAAGRVDAAWQGRLSVVQSQITQVRVPIKGTGDFRLRVYVDGSGGAPVYDSGLQAAPGVLTYFTVNAVDMSAQPTGQKRYYVVVEAHIDSAEAVYVGRPYVYQE